MGKFITIPEEVYKNYKATPSLLFGLIQSLALERGYCWASNKSLAKELNVEVTTIKRFLKTLKEDGFIHSEGKRQRKIYIRCKTAPVKGQNCTSKRCKTAPVTGAELHHYNNKDNNNDIYKRYKNTSYDIEELMKIE